MQPISSFMKECGENSLQGQHKAKGNEELGLDLVRYSFWLVSGSQPLPTANGTIGPNRARPHKLILFMWNCTNKRVKQGTATTYNSPGPAMAICSGGTTKSLFSHPTDSKSKQRSFCVVLCNLVYWFVVRRKTTSSIFERTAICKTAPFILVVQVDCESHITLQTRFCGTISPSTWSTNLRTFEI